MTGKRNKTQLAFCVQLDTITVHDYAHPVLRIRLVVVEAGRSEARILARLRSATFGNSGDCEPVGEGVSEMRIHVEPGYQEYFVRIGATVYVLLTGGDKSSQKRDIARAKYLALELKEKP